MHIYEDFVEQVKTACDRLSSLCAEYNKNPSEDIAREYNRIYFRLEQNYTALADALSPMKEEIEQEEPIR